MTTDRLLKPSSVCWSRSAMLPLDFFRPRTFSIPHNWAACLVLDVGVPGMGGLELQRRLAAEKVHTPIIFITAHGEQEVSAAEVRGGEVALLRKPFSQE